MYSTFFSNVVFSINYRTFNNISSFMKLIRQYNSNVILNMILFLKNKIINSEWFQVFDVREEEEKCFFFNVKNFAAFCTRVIRFLINSLVINLSNSNCHADHLHAISTRSSNWSHWNLKLNSNILSLHSVSFLVAERMYTHCFVLWC